MISIFKTVRRFHPTTYIVYFQLQKSDPLHFPCWHWAFLLCVFMCTLSRGQTSQVMTEREKKSSSSWCCSLKAFHKDFLVYLRTVDIGLGLARIMCVHVHTDKSWPREESNLHLPSILVVWRKSIAFHKDFLVYLRTVNRFLGRRSMFFYMCIWCWFSIMDHVLSDVLQ